MRQGRRRRGVGSVLTLTFLKRGVDPRTFYDVINFSFALNCINIEQTELLMLVKRKLLKNDANFTAPNKQRNIASPNLVTTVMRL